MSSNSFLRVSLFQTDIIWEDKQANLLNLENKLGELNEQTDIVVLPELFSTGVSVKNRKDLPEPIDGNTISVIKRLAHKYQTAICGSYIALCEGAVYNRAFFVSPDGKEQYYDKHHLFSIGEESNHFTAGNKRIVFDYLGWNICLLVCYDLRFPVWCRNKNNEYDLLIVVANWPASREKVWKTLLCARAIENQSYVCGVNRVGIDGLGINYSGQSSLLDAKGNTLTTFADKEEGVRNISIELNSLRTFRRQFPVWKDADVFEIKNNTEDF
ncbi:MAG: amidohydrolase [Bacteroides sp.]